MYLESEKTFDYKGVKLCRGERYYIFDISDKESVLVHLEDVAEYLNDDSLVHDNHAELIKEIYNKHGHRPITI